MSLRFPHPDRFEIGGRAFTAAEVVERLAPYLSERRRARIAEVVGGRTYAVVPVLEGVHDLGNVNAVLRSAEGLGYGAAHLAALQGEAARWAEQLRDGAPQQPVATGLQTAQRQSQGADKWLDLHVWPSASDACAQLHGLGYAVVATHLDAAAVPITEVDFTRPTALVFGNERDGVSEELLRHADATCAIPIDGFVQSFNVSVAAALGLYHARQDRLARQGRHGDLAAAEQEVLTAAYYLRAAKAPEALLARSA